MSGSRSRVVGRSCVSAVRVLGPSQTDGLDLTVHDTDTEEVAALKHKVRSTAEQLKRETEKTKQLMNTKGLVVGGGMGRRRRRRSSVIVSDGVAATGWPYVSGCTPPPPVMHWNGRTPQE